MLLFRNPLLDLRHVNAEEVLPKADNRLKRAGRGASKLESEFGSP
jgi:hypothetical protein